MQADIELNFTKWKKVIVAELWRIPKVLVEIDTYEGNLKYLFI